jgi:hypothetical protein
MFSPFQRALVREQQAFLARDRRGWGEHLVRVRNFLGVGLERADPERPTLILGAGSGLEVPWAKAPKVTTGWDADPFSRLRTLFRHRRWSPWVFGDITGAFAPLEAAAQRAVRESWSGRRRRREVARVRLAALLPSIQTDPLNLQAWILRQRPGTILAANFMGQLAPSAQRIVERAFAPEDPWESDPEKGDALAEALDAWTARLVRHLLETLAASGAELWLVHDRAVLSGGKPLELAVFTPDWRAQLQATERLEILDPLAGVDVVAALEGLPPLRAERWLWPLGPDQLHVVEALAYERRSELDQIFGS